MLHCRIYVVQGGIWLIDSECSNHMVGIKELFQELNETVKQTTRLGDEKQMQVACKGTMAIKVSSGKVNLLKTVQYVSHQVHNFLIVGQLLLSSYVVVFNNKCLIKDKETVSLLTKVQMTKQRMFLLDVANVECANVVVCKQQGAMLWHLRYGHLHQKGLQILIKKHLVKILPLIKSLESCKGYICSKNSRQSFPKGNSLASLFTFRAGAC